MRKQIFTNKNLTKVSKNLNYSKVNNSLLLSNPTSSNKSKYYPSNLHCKIVSYQSKSYKCR